MSLSRTEEILRDGLRTKAYSAAALAVGKGDQILLKTAIGHVSYLEGADEVTDDTLFDMASVSKILGTTFCAFHMIENGQLSLLDQIGDFYPDCPEDKKQICVRQLMTHTSGLPAEIALYQVCRTPEEAVDVILNHPLEYVPETKTVYSCMGFILLGKIMEKITGRPLDELAEEWTFAPLGMKKTGYHPVSRCSADPHCVYTETMSLSGPTPPGIVHDENARFLNGVSGNAGVFSTLNDMMIFCRMVASHGSPLIGEHLFRAAVKNYTPAMDDNRGLGFQLSGPAPSFFGDLWGMDGIGHTGFTGTSFAVDPRSGFYVVLLTNRVHPTRENFQLTRIRHLIHNTAVTEFLEK